MFEKELNIVGICVGGVYFETTTKTLAKSEIFNDYSKEDTELLYVDRDPYLFPYVLNFMRNGEIVAYRDRVLLESLVHEAKYFKLIELEKQLNKMLDSIEHDIQVESGKLITEFRKILNELHNQTKSDGRVLRRRPS